MRTRLLGTSLLAASLALGLCGGFSPPMAFGASYVQRARAALAKGDLDAAQIELRNAVRSEPQNAEARFLLAEVQLQLGDPVAAETQAKAAEARGYDKRAVVPRSRWRAAWPISCSTTRTRLPPPSPGPSSSIPPTRRPGSPMRG